MAFVPFTKDDQPTMAAFNEKFQQAIDEAVSRGVKIEVGSYVGTGTYGTLNRCRLTFSSTPKMVFIKASNDARTMMLFYGHTRGDSTESTSNKPFTTWDGNTVTWYTDISAYVQFNSSGETYDYICYIDAQLTGGDLIDRPQRGVSQPFPNDKSGGNR